jgi:hypothetical protein
VGKGLSTLSSLPPVGSAIGQYEAEQEADTEEGRGQGQVSVGRGRFGPGVGHGRLLVVRGEATLLRSDLESLETR